MSVVFDGRRRWRRQGSIVRGSARAGGRAHGSQRPSFAALARSPPQPRPDWAIPARILGNAAACGRMDLLKPACPQNLRPKHPFFFFESPPWQEWHTILRRVQRAKQVGRGRTISGSADSMAPSNDAPGGDGVSATRSFRPSWMDGPGLSSRQLPSRDLPAGLQRSERGKGLPSVYSIDKASVQLPSSFGGQRSLLWLKTGNKHCPR